MHLSFASPWVDTLDIPREPTGTQGEWHSFGIFFSRGGWDLFSFGNDFAGPWGHTHGICSGQCDRHSEKYLTWYHSRCVKMRKKRGKKFDILIKYCVAWKLNVNTP